MKTLSKRVRKLLTFMFENDLEIVSYGLGPNPNGFCFENHGKASKKVLKYVSKELDSLTNIEIKEIREAVF